MCGVFGFYQVLATLAAGRPSVLSNLRDRGDRAAEHRAHANHLNGSDEMYRRLLERTPRGWPFRSTQRAPALPRSTPRWKTSPSARRARTAG